MSSATWEEMHLNATDGILVQKSVKVPCDEQTWSENQFLSQFTQGGVCKFEEEESEEEGRAGFYGWMGFGGSVFQWNPKLNIGWD